jgi:hypothetical protein
MKCNYGNFGNSGSQTTATENQYTIGSVAAASPLDGCTPFENNDDLKVVLSCMAMFMIRPSTRCFKSANKHTQGAVVLVKRGKCAFENKVLAAANAGAIAVVVINTGSLEKAPRMVSVFDFSLKLYIEFSHESRLASLMFVSQPNKGATLPASKNLTLPVVMVSQQVNHGTG